jgi:hypothetical protein
MLNSEESFAKKLSIKKHKISNNIIKNIFYSIVIGFGVIIESE